ARPEPAPQTPATPTPAPARSVAMEMGCGWEAGLARVRRRRAEQPRRPELLRLSRGCKARPCHRQARVAPLPAPLRVPTEPPSPAPVPGAAPLSGTKGGGAGPVASLGLTRKLPADARTPVGWGLGKGRCVSRPGAAGARDLPHSPEPELQALWRCSRVAFAQGTAAHSLGIVIEEVDKEDLRGDGEQSALYTTLQAAAKELVRKWALQREGDDGTFLALATVTDKAKKREMEKDFPGAESISLNIKEDRSKIPDLVALLAVRDASDEETMGSDASQSESQENGDQEREGVDIPEFVAILLGWSDKEAALPEVLSVMAKDTSGTRVKVEEAGRQVDAVDVAEVTEEEKEKAWQSGRFRCAKGNLGEVLALLAARRNRESEETSEDVESEESEPEDRASRKPRAKRARTAFRALGPAPRKDAPPRYN
ncbi:hypothetical protein E2I00_009921, partial [Balaenoptera physalus]